MSQHLPSQQRQILALQKRIAELEQMQREYNALLNYLVVEHNANIGCQEGDEYFTIISSRLQKITFLPIVSTIADDGSTMTIRRNNNQTISRINKP
jgi:hypothetical protein